ncbi:LysE family transporter [Flavobacterium sp.]|uniref:LysE family transporter n=1 Tax=Flavobacterium sp. TaxID=239 RepID=UPI003C5D70A3
MKILKNIVIGFIVSFLGSLPFGYLNFVGLEIYSKSGIESLVFFILGIILVEAFVIYFTLIFANKLVNNKRLMKWIDVFGVFFLLIIGYSFYNHASESMRDSSVLDQYITYSTFLIGVVLNCFNFLQLPFWTAWNLYLINERYIVTRGKLKFYYLFGTLVGIFMGMLAVIYFLNTLTTKIGFLTKYLMPVIIPVFFLILAVFQLRKVINKHFSRNEIRV